MLSTFSLNSINARSLQCLIYIFLWFFSEVLFLILDTEFDFIAKIAGSIYKKLFNSSLYNLNTLSRAKYVTGYNVSEHSSIQCILPCYKKDWCLRNLYKQNNYIYISIFLCFLLSNLYTRQENSFHCFILRSCDVISMYTSFNSN